MAKGGMPAARQDDRQRDDDKQMRPILFQRITILVGSVSNVAGASVGSNRVREVAISGA
jgi:hypothetical protein